jgi:cobaltochelatase CobS
MYTDMTVSQLRSEARNMTTPPASGVEISGANKHQLLAWLAGTTPTTPTTPTTTIIDTPDTIKSVRIYEPTQPAVNFNGQANDYLANLQSALQPLLSNIETKPAIDESRIIELIKENMPNAQEIVIKPVNMKEVNVGIAHIEFPELVKNAVARIPVMLVGPSGSGKTHAAHQLAEGLGLNYEVLSVGPMTSKVDLVGYQDANGVYHDTGFVRMYRDGGVIMVDEIDAGNAGVLTQLNTATSNGSMSTPAGMVQMHADCIIVAGANTYGNGATPEYVGRNKLDLATLKRFYRLTWNYDESIEASIAGAESAEEVAIVQQIQEMRATAKRLELRVAITPRDSKYAVKLLRAGMSKDRIFQGLIFADLDASTITKIKG